MEEQEILDEAMIILGNKNDTLFGNVVIMAGGSGSGRGFVLDNLVQIKGINIDVDKLKLLSIRINRIADALKKELKTDILDFKNPNVTSAVHKYLSDDLNLPNRQQAAIFTSIYAANPDRKPNLIFDVTLKDIRKLENICYDVERLGYNKKKIHIIWVINDVEVALEQNKTRDRVVSKHVLLNSHTGVSVTMKTILDMGNDLQEYMDGNIVFSFNKAGIDAEAIKNNNGKHGYITKADYIYVKRVGKRQLSSSELSDEIVAKIKERTKGTNINVW